MSSEDKTGIHPIVQFIGGIILYGLLHCVVYFFLAMVSFDFFPCGSDFLNNSSIDGGVFFALFTLFFVQLFITKSWLKKPNYRSFGAGSIFPLVSTGILTLIMSTSLIYGNYYTIFSKEDWQDREKRTVELSRFIINNEILVDAERNDVISLLGEPDDSNDQDSILVDTYLTYDPYAPILVDYKNGVVDKVDLACYDW